MFTKFQFYCHFYDTCADHLTALISRLVDCVVRQMNGIQTLEIIIIDKDVKHNNRG